MWLEDTSLTTGSNTSLRRRFPGTHSSPLTNPTVGSWGSSVLKQGKLNTKSVLGRDQQGVMDRFITLTVILNSGIVMFICFTKGMHYTIYNQTDIFEIIHILKCASEAGSRWAGWSAKRAYHEGQLDWTNARVLIGHTLTSSRKRRSRNKLPQFAPDRAHISAISRCAICPIICERRQKNVRS